MTPEILSILNSAVGMACGAAVTGVAVFFINKIKQAYGLPQRMAKAEDIGMITIRMLGSYGKVFDIMIGIMAGNKINGNIGDARTAIAEAETEMKQFFERQVTTNRERNVK